MFFQKIRILSYGLLKDMVQNMKELLHIKKDLIMEKFETTIPSKNLQYRDYIGLHVSLIIFK